MPGLACDVCKKLEISPVCFGAVVLWCFGALVLSREEDALVQALIKGKRML